MSPVFNVDDCAALATRAAWVCFVDGKTQGEVAELLGVENTKACSLKMCTSTK